MSSRAEYEQLIDKANGATKARFAIQERFRTMLAQPIDPGDPIFKEWELAETQERTALTAVAEFRVRYATRG
jgi:hypothetical protein